MIFHRLLISIVIILCFLSCNRRLEVGKPYKVHISATGLEQTQEFIEILSGKSDIILSLDPLGQYFIDDLYIESNHGITIKGNGSTINVRNDCSSVFTFIDPRSLDISDLDIQSIDKKNMLYDFAINVHTPANRTEFIFFNNVNITNVESGGIRIQNIDPKGKERNWLSGAEEIKIQDCNFINYGKNSALYVRGSHRNVTISDVTVEDPLGIQTRNHVIDISAEVKRNFDNVGNVLLRNVKSRYTRRETIFVQKTKSLVVENVSIDSSGYNKFGETFLTNGIKLDDLGRSSSAMLDGLKISNSSSEVFAGISIEQSQDVGISSGVILKDVISDKPVRLGGDGNHSISKSTFINTNLQLLSSGNKVDDINFLNSERNLSIYIAASTANSISNCDFRNGWIKVGSNANNLVVQDCSLEVSLPQQKQLIYLMLNAENGTNEILVQNCVIPEDVLLVHSSGNRKALRATKLTIDSNADVNLSKDIRELSQIESRNK